MMTDTYKFKRKSFVHKWLLTFIISMCCLVNGQEIVDIAQIAEKDCQNAASYNQVDISNQQHPSVEGSDPQIDINQINQDQSKSVIVIVGQSGMGKTTFINMMARKELGQTGKYRGQTTHINSYEFNRDGQEFFVIDTVGLHDNRDLGLTDDKILSMIEQELGLYPETYKIRFVLVQALSEKRFNLPMEADKYRTVFGDDFLKSSIILGSSIDWLNTEERKEAKDELKSEMRDKFNTEFIIKDFSLKMKEADEMVSDALMALAKQPPYSNTEIQKIQMQVQDELLNQKNRTIHPENFESYLETRQVQESIPVTKERVRKWTEYQQVVRKKRRKFRRSKRWVETIEIPRQITETYVDNEMQTVTKNFEAFRIKYTEDQLFKKAKDIVSEQIKN